MKKTFPDTDGRLIDQVCIGAVRSIHGNVITVSPERKDADLSCDEVVTLADGNFRCIVSFREKQVIGMQMCFSYAVQGSTGKQIR